MYHYFVKKSSYNFVVFFILPFCTFSLTHGPRLRIVHLERSDDGNPHSVIEAVPTASLLQTPGARADAATWCDESGHVWLFGGEGYDDNAASTHPKLLNDLWLFNTSRLEWTVMHNGRRQYTLSTNSGERTKSREAEAYQNRTNVAPKPRKKASSCGVPGIVFVIFGGIDSNGSSLSDTWIYLIQKSQWLLLSGNVSQLVEHRTPWFTNISWCHLDALYVVGHEAGDVEEIWKFSLRTLKWSNESLYLSEQPRCNYTPPIAPHATTDSISLLWNATFYLYQWQIVYTANASNLLTLSVNVRRWNSLPSAKFVNDWYSEPILWSELSNVCRSPAVLQWSYDCGSANGHLCNFHRSYQMKSSTSWNEQRHGTGSWFYGDDMYIFGGQEEVGDSRTFFNDMYIIKQSDSGANSTYFMFVLGSIIVLLAFVLIGLIVFCILRYCDYRHGRAKSRELRIRYMPLQDLSLYE